jgi:hypothetical protein
MPPCAHYVRLTYATWLTINGDKIRHLAYVPRLSTYYHVLKEQNRPILVEAKNSVPYIWAPLRADGASGAPGYLLRVNRPKGGRFCFWKRESEQAEEVKKSEAHSCTSHGSPVYGISGGSHG